MGRRYGEVEDWVKIKVKIPPGQWQEEVQGCRRFGHVDNKIKVRVEVWVGINITS